MTVNFSSQGTQAVYRNAGFEPQKTTAYYGQTSIKAQTPDTDEVAIKNKEKKDPKKKIILAAAAATLIAASAAVVTFVTSRGKTINTALGNGSKFLDNAKQGFYSLFKDSGRKLYEGITKKISGIYTDVNRTEHAISETGKNFPQLIEGRKILEGIKNGSITNLSKAKRQAGKLLHPDATAGLVNNGDISQNDANKLVELFKEIEKAAKEAQRKMPKDGMAAAA